MPAPADVLAVAIDGHNHQVTQADPADPVLTVPDSVRIVLKCGLTVDTLVADLGDARFHLVDDTDCPTCLA